MWEEAIEITVACVLAIQMGLVEAIGKVLHYEFRILSCPRCATFWLSLGIHLLHLHPLLDSVFASFLSSYAALWLCLLYDAIARVYNYAYEKVQEEEVSPEVQPGSDEVPEL